LTLLGHCECCPPVSRDWIFIAGSLLEAGLRLESSTEEGFAIFDLQPSMLTVCIVVSVQTIDIFDLSVVGAPCGLIRVLVLEDVAGM
jgi:hypothetical protein